MIKIARNQNAEWFFNEMKECLLEQMFDWRSENFWKLIYLCPEYIADLIEVMPEICESRAAHEALSFRNFKVEEKCYEKITDYIRIFRLWYEYLEAKEEKKMDKSLDMLKDMIVTILKDNINKEIQISKLTIHQIENLMWFIKFLNNEGITESLKGKIQEDFGWLYGELDIWNKKY